MSIFGKVAKIGVSQVDNHANAVLEAEMQSRWGAQGLQSQLGGINAAVPETQTFAGSDVTVIFMIPPDVDSLLSGPNQQSYLQTKDLQTITISSTSSILPVRRIGEKKPIAYTTGARTFAGSMVFTVINKDPFMELFGLDILNQSVTNDGSWHIDSMPPMDCAIIAQNETGGLSVQVIHGIRITNWGTTYSIDDMYLESTYTYIAEHVTPFVVSTFDAAQLYGAITKAFVDAEGVVRRGTSEERASQYLNLFRMSNKIEIAQSNKIPLQNRSPLDAVNTTEPGLIRSSQIDVADKLLTTIKSVVGASNFTGPSGFSPATAFTMYGVSAFTSAELSTSSSPYSLDDRVWY